MHARTVLRIATLALGAHASAQTLPAPTAFTTEWRMSGVTQGVVDSTFGPGVLEFADGPTDERVPRS